MKASQSTEAITTVARWVVDRGAAPAAVVSAAWRNGDEWRVESGAAGMRSAQSPSPVSTRSVFDLASVTKPIVAVTATRVAARLGISLSTPIGNLHPTLAHTRLASTSLELLLAHRAGLVPHLELFAPVRARTSFRRSNALVRAASATVPGFTPVPLQQGHPPLYSDLGYLVLGELLEYLTGETLDELVKEEVTAPLGLALGSVAWWLRRQHVAIARFVPTENVRWRGGEIVAQSHDENAWAWAGHGTAGHAGLFGTADAVCRFGCAVLDALRHRGQLWLNDGDLSTLLAARPGGSLRGGFDGKSSVGSSAGSRSSSETVGHLGFTGTSFWCDPIEEVVTVLLTNRVSPTRHSSNLREIRPRVHDALFDIARSAAMTD